jgi:hypothetical protein
VLTENTSKTSLKILVRNAGDLVLSTCVFGSRTEVVPRSLKFIWRL